MKPNKEIHPPKWADLLLKWFCSERVIETLQGDLYELYEKRRRKSSKLKADYGFVGDVFSSLRPFAMRKLWSKHTNNNAMLRNNLKVAWRGLIKHKMYSIIKVSGLSIGITACLLISLFVIDELGHDTSYADSERIYRLINVESNPQDPGNWTAHQALTAGLMKEQFPEIEMSGRLIPYKWYVAGDNQVRRSDRTQNTYEEGFAYMDQELLEILTPKMVYGTLEEALIKPNSVVLTREKSEKYFPGENPIGKTLILDEDVENPWVVGAVIENNDKNNHLQFDFLLTLTDEEFWRGEQTSWCCSNYNTYIKLREGVNPLVMEQKMAALMRELYIPYLKERGNQYWEDVEKYREYNLQPVNDIHLYSRGISDILKHGDIKIVWLFSAIAVFVLLLACINFVNLSTAKSANRAKEVGLRKVVGSLRSNLVSQFLTESILVTFISTIIGVVLAGLLIPSFNAISGKSLEMPLTEWWLIPSMIILALVVGTLAGIYPAFYLSAFKPIEAISGKLSRGSKTSTLRGVMVVFQFSCSVILIVGSLIVYKQMQYMLKKDLGYDKDHVLMIQGVNSIGDKLDLLQNELLKIPEVKSVTASNYLPVSGTKRDQNEFWIEGRSKIDKGIGGQMWNVDDDYIETLGMNLMEGRDFDKFSNRDSTSLIINQTMVRELGLEDPVGARIQNWRGYTVIGVVQDFHFESMRDSIGPLALRLDRYGSVVPVKIQTTDMKATLTAITNTWDEIMPNQPIRYSFLDEVFESMYDDVQRTGNVFAGFSILAIFVACLGLFGLSAFMVEQRSKEISIRKVLGASIKVIFKLLTFNFMKLIGISLLIAIPISFYLMQEWLSDFEFKVNIGWMVFVIASLLITLISILTISYESLKAAIINPVTGLRSE
ncbi:FtsX-like permease family protein [Ekhidna sp.]